MSQDCYERLLLHSLRCSQHITTSWSFWGDDLIGVKRQVALPCAFKSVCSRYVHFMTVQSVTRHMTVQSVIRHMHVEMAITKIIDCCRPFNRWRGQIIYFESIARVSSLSLSGKILYDLRLADLFFVQWPDLQQRFPRALYAGRLF